MTHGGDDPDRRMAAEVFRAVLEQPEPERPVALAAVRAGGRRLRARRRLALGSAVLVTVPVLAVTAALAVPGAAGAPQLRDLVGLRPAAQPTHYGMDQLDALQKRLRSALAAHLPAGYTKVLDGSGPTNFRLARADGGYTAVGATMGNPMAPGSRLPSPCEPQDGKKVYSSDCVARTLPDGSTGWLSRSTTGYAGVDFLLVTPQGRIAGLGTMPTAVPPQGEGGEPQESKPMTLQDLDALVSDPEVLAALEAVPLDAPG